MYLKQHQPDKLLYFSCKNQEPFESNFEHNNKARLQAKQHLKHSLNGQYETVLPCKLRKKCLRQLCFPDLYELVMSLLSLLHSLKHYTKILNTDLKLLILSLAAHFEKVIDSSQACLFIEEWDMPSVRYHGILNIGISFFHFH